MMYASTLLVLLPLAFAWPVDDKEMMMKMMMHDKGVNMMKMSSGDDKDMMMNYAMKMWKKEMSGGHYPGDADGCKKEESWKEMMEAKEREEEAKKMMDEYQKFKEYQEKKKEMEERAAKEEQEKMYEVWQKQKEMQMREEKEKEFKSMVDSFQNQKHTFAFKLTHEFLQLCHCGEISDEMDRLAMFEVRNGTDLMNNMTTAGANAAMDSGDMETLANKMMSMNADEKKKVYMSGLIKSMCNGARDFVQHAKQFEQLYMVSYNDNDNSTRTD